MYTISNKDGAPVGSIGNADDLDNDAFSLNNKTISHIDKSSKKES